MTLAEFEATLAARNPPDGLSNLLTALWWDGKGHWSRAHEMAQTDETPSGAWVHAYLHRKEGDNWNAGYWYRRAHRTASTLPLPEEWKEIVTTLLDTVPDHLKPTS